MEPMDESMMKPRLGELREISTGLIQVEAWQPVMDEALKSFTGCNADQVYDFDHTTRAPNQPVRQERKFAGVKQRPSGKWAAVVRESVDKDRVWLGSYDTAEEAALEYHRATTWPRGLNTKPDFSNRNNFNKGKSVSSISTSTSGQKYWDLWDGFSWDMSFQSYGLGGFADDIGGLSSHSNKFTAQEENNEFNIPRPVNETSTFHNHSIAGPNWEALRKAMLHQDRVPVENKGKVSFKNRNLHVIGDTRSPGSPYEKAISILGKTFTQIDEDNLIPCFGFGDGTTHDQGVFSLQGDHSPCHGFQEVLDCYRRVAPNMKLSGDVIKELPVQDAGYATNAESQSSNFLTEKSPPLQEIIEPEKDLVVLDHSHQLQVVEDSIHKKGLVAGAEKYDSYIHLLDKKCIEETSKEVSSPEKGYSYDILSAHFGKLQDDAAKCFNVSRSTFKRICRDNGIKRWRSHKKKLDSQSSSKLRRVNNEEPSRTNSYCSTILSLQDTNMITVKATYNEIAIKFEVLDSSGIVDLEDNVIERLKMERDTFSIKYQDDEGDWVLIACDKDLQKCIKTSRLLKKTTIKMLVDRPINHYAS